MAETTGNSSLFPVFVLSILSLVLLPWTIYKCCFATSTDAAKIWETADKKRGFVRKVRASMTAGNVVLVGLWCLAALLVVHIHHTSKDMTPFDPFQILGVSTDATPGDIRKAYFQLSRRYHPDKSPNPEDHKYFAEYVSKAYKALTDPVARENYEKHGHPDGPQGIDLGIALPEWLFTKDPRALLVLVVVFVLLPLSIMAWYLFRSDKYTGPNNIMHDTMAAYIYDSRYGVKESQGVTRILDTLVVAKEFITIHTPHEHQPAFEDMRRLTLSFHPELKEKPQFWKRRASIVKAHMLLFAHLERAHSDVPPILNANLNFVLEKTIPLLQEIFKIACSPRRLGGHGWLTPAISAVQCMQCVTQAVPLSTRRMDLTKRDINEGYAALLQLPGMDMQVAKQLGKKRVRSIQDLLNMGDAERTKLLLGLKFNEETLHDIDTALQSLPSIEMHAKIFVEGEEEICEGDVVTCRVRLLLSRKSHSTGDVSDADLTEAGVQCFSPYYPGARPEKWYIVLSIPRKNRIIASKHVVLKEAELASLHRTSTEENEEPGQIVDLQFSPFLEGSCDIQVGCYSDCWIGVDKVFPTKVTIKKATKIRSATKPAPRQASSDDEDDDQPHEAPAQATGATSDKASDSGSEGGSEGDENDAEDEYDYDTEETGELETGTDEEETEQ